MQPIKQNTLKSNNYLHRVLVYGTKPFLYRGRVRSLLGMPESDCGNAAFSPTLPPVGFKYANHTLMGDPWTADSPGVTGDFTFQDEQSSDVEISNNPIEEINPENRPSSQENHDRMIGPQKHSIKDEAQQDRGAIETNQKKVAPKDMGKREIIEIPGFSQKKISFPSLSIEDNEWSPSQKNIKPPLQKVSPMNSSGNELPTGAPQSGNTVELPKTGTGKVQKQSDVKTRKNGAQLADGRKKSVDHQPEPVKERGAYTQMTNKIEESVDNQSIPGLEKIQRQDKVKGGKSEARFANGLKDSVDHTSMPETGKTQKQGPAEKKAAPTRLPGRLNKQENHRMKEVKEEVEPVPVQEDQIDSLSNRTAAMPIEKQEKQEPAEKKTAPTRLPGRLNKQENHRMKAVKEEVEPVPVQEDQISGLSNRTAAMPIEKQEKQEPAEKKAAPTQLLSRLNKQVDHHMIAVEEEVEPVPVQEAQISGLSNRTAAMPIEKQEPAEKKAAPTRLPGRLNKQENHRMKAVKEEVEPVPVQEAQIDSLSNRTAAMPIEKQEPAEKKTAPTRLPGRLNKQVDRHMRAVKEEVEPVPVHEGQISSLSNRTAAMRIEQLRQEVHKLKAGDSSPSIDENREIKEEEQKQIPNPPLQPAVFSRQSTQQPQVPWAFWERSYLSRFHLKTLI